MTTIHVYCDDKSHGTKLVTVNSVHRDQTDRWVSLPGQTRKRGEFSDMTSLGPDDELLPRRYALAEASEERTLMRRRRHFNFGCELCGWSLRARAETLDPVFDKLAVHGVDRVSLGGPCC